MCIQQICYYLTFVNSRNASLCVQSVTLGVYFQDFGHKPFHYLLKNIPKDNNIRIYIPLRLYVLPPILLPKQAVATTLLNKSCCLFLFFFSLEIIDWIGEIHKYVEIFFPINVVIPHQLLQYQLYKSYQVGSYFLSLFNISYVFSFFQVIFPNIF